VTLRSGVFKLKGRPSNAPFEPTGQPRQPKYRQSMEILSQTADAILPAFLIIGAGWFLRARGLLTDSLVTGFNRLVFMAVLPVMLFQKIGSQPLGEVFRGDLMVGSVLGIGLVWPITYALVKLHSGISPDREGVIVQGAGRPNMAVVGLAVLTGGWGAKVLAPAGMVLAPLVLLVNLFAVVFLLLPHRSRGGGNSVAPMLSAVATNPLIIGTALGVAKSASGIGTPAAIDSALEMLSDMAIPAALLGVGASLRPEKISVDLKATLTASALKLVFMPALTWLILKYLLGLSGMNLGIGVVFASAPTATVSFIMAEQMRGDPDLAASILVFSHLAAIFTMSLWLAALFQWG